jgi:hypothetical protein
MFDPYCEWLGIPRGETPATYYQLLAIGPNERDTEVIKEAALRQTACVRVHQIGQHAEICTRILNEIAQARTVLLNPKARQEYDVRLAGDAKPACAEPPSPSVPPVRPEVSLSPQTIPVPAAPVQTSWHATTRHRSYMSHWLAAFVYLALLTAGGMASFWTTSEVLQTTAQVQGGAAKTGLPTKSKPPQQPTPARGAKPP